MSSKLLRSLIFSFLGLCSTLATAQTHFTPYDDCPGNIKSYKPAFSDDLPAWAKMLYQPDISYNAVSTAYEEWMGQERREKSAMIRYYKIWSRAVEPYVQDDGKILLPDPQLYYKKLQETQLSAGKASSSKSSSDWTFLGPRETFWLNESGSPVAPSSCPWQANVYSFDVSASDNNIIYCGTETGYINKTTDKGHTWSIMAQEYYFGGSITAIAVHPVNDSIVYAAAGNQIHKSTDGGVTWTPLLSTGNLFYADRLVIDPNNASRLIAASSNGLYITNDAGTTWAQKWSAPCYDCEIKTDDSNMIFALTKAGSDFSMIVSTDGGANFSTMASFPTGIAETSGGYTAVTPANPNALFALMLSANNTPYLYKGVNSGGSWVWNLLATGGTSAFPMNNGQGYFDLVLGVSQLNENIILAGTTTLYKSVNGGANFTAVGGYSGNFAIHPDIQDIKFLPSGETWVSTDGGMNLTSDNFGIDTNYHVRINGIIGSDMWGFDQGWNEDIVVGGRYHNGNTAISELYNPKALRMGGAESPTGWVLQGRSRHVAFNDLGNGWILPMTAEGEPEGRFLFTKFPNMDEYGGRRGNMVFHPNYYGTIYLGQGTGFWRSTDMGVTWDLLYTFTGNMRYLQISYSHPDVIYADVIGKGLYRTDDGGLSWTLKPSLTSPPYGSTYWKGKLFIAVSPYNENVVYACLQNGMWSADLGKVFKSTDGGDTWTDWSGTVSEYLKCMVVQPTSSGQDLVYLFTQAANGHEARVYYRKDGMADWSDFGNNYPAGMAANIALPFFRDSKLRVAGNGGVWQSPMEEDSFTPIINPWIEKKDYNCMLDTLYFDDHSILNHAGATWHWSISPTPAFIENVNIRNPKVVLGTPGTYDVSLTVNQGGQNYTKTITGMVTTTTCPSISDCNNPAELPKDQWSLLYVDSQELNYPGYATMSFDGDMETIWHTRWSTGDDPYPHEIQIALGDTFRISKFIYYNRQDNVNGRIKDYKLYISNDSLNWGLPVDSGQFVNTAAPQTINFTTPPEGRFFRLLALNGDVNGNPWASAAEFSLVGCNDLAFGIAGITQQFISAYPIPAGNMLTLNLPPARLYCYEVFSDQGQLIEKGRIDCSSGKCDLSLDKLKPGPCFIRLLGEDGVIYRVKAIKI